MQQTVRVGLVGSQFISTIHAESLRRCPGVELFAVASPTPGHAEAFAGRWEIPHHRTDYHAILE
jgi:myo-inositol 2-dehydrogenase / D-chiro-inositol 1-dehydrogenase